MAKEKFDWSRAPHWATHFARNSDGRGVWFSKKPSYHETDGYWYSMGTWEFDLEPLYQEAPHSLVRRR